MNILTASQSLPPFQSKAYYVGYQQDKFYDILDLDIADMATDTNICATYSNNDPDGDEIEAEILQTIL